MLKDIDHLIYTLSMIAPNGLVALSLIVIAIVVGCVSLSPVFNKNYLRKK